MIYGILLQVTQSYSKPGITNVNQIPFMLQKFVKVIMLNKCIKVLYDCWNKSTFKKTFIVNIK
jgi:hypothetical protein